MRVAGRLWPFDLDALPSLCQAKGCYKDAPKGRQFCDRHQKLRDIQRFRQQAAGRRSINHLPVRQILDTNLYAIRAGEHVKFGISVSVQSRLRSMQTGSPEKLTLYGFVPVIARVETAVHHYLKADHSHGEWFHWTPRSIAVAALVRAKDLAGLLELLDDRDLIEAIAERLAPPNDSGLPVVCRPVD